MLPPMSKEAFLVLEARVAFIIIGWGLSWTLLDGLWSQVPIFAALSPHGLALPTQFTMAGQVCDGEVA